MQLKPDNCLGTIYTELTNAGLGRTASGKIRKKWRYVAEIRIDGKRQRFRSNRLDTVQQWLISKTAQKQNSKTTKNDKHPRLHPRRNGTVAQQVLIRPQG